MTIVPAAVEDAPGIARAHIRSWQAAYAHVLAPDFLDTLSIEARSERWHDILIRAESQTFVVRLEDTVVGFVSFGHSRDEGDAPNQGEIWALYAAPDVWGFMTGRITEAGGASPKPHPPKSGDPRRSPRAFGSQKLSRVHKGLTVGHQFPQLESSCASSVPLHSRIDVRVKNPHTLTMRRIPRSKRLPPAHRISLLSTAVCTAAFFIPAITCAFDITAKLERDGNGPGGPIDTACTFCTNKETRVSTSFSGGFPPSPHPVALPSNSEIGGTAFVDLATGVMSGSAHAASFGDFEQHQIRFVSSLRETIDIDLPAGMPAAEKFAIFTGIVQATASSTNRASARALYILQVHNVRATVSLDHRDGWNVGTGKNDPAVETAPLGSGYQLRLKVPIPLSGELIIDSQLEGTAWAEARTSTGVGMADVGGINTATLTMTLPEGATYTSTSDVFLTAPPSPEISIEMTADTVTIHYTGTLEASTSMAEGSWAPVSGATSPHQFPIPATGLLFYRASQP